MLKGREKEEVFCSICGISNKETHFYYNTLYGKNLCRRHYDQIRTRGKIIKRTNFDANEYVLYENYAEIICYNKYQLEKARIIIDLEDVDKCKKYKWCLSSGYPTAHIKINQNRLRLNRFLLNYKGKLLVDHKDTNPLNNIKTNLRVCEQKYNNINCKLGKNNTSGIIGVTWDKKRSKWTSQIAKDYKCYRLGLFENKKEAIIARLQAELKYFKEGFAPQRHLFKEYNISIKESV